jgi:hypothetical protein
MIVSAFRADRNTIENENRSSKLESILYSKEYTIQHLRGYANGHWEDTYLAHNSEIGNEELKKDALYLLSQFDQDDIIIKYRDEPIIRRIYKDGNEKPLSLNMYDSDLQNKSYIFQGLSFSFKEQRQYKNITDKSELKPGMIVEICNNNKWIEKQVEDPEKEWLNVYQLFAKHNKIRLSF